MRKCGNTPGGNPLFRVFRRRPLSGRISSDHTERSCDMNRTSSAAAAAGAAVLLLAGTAASRTCYSLFDRNDNVVYRDTFSPVDLSDQGEAARAQLRQRGEYLLISEDEQCQQVTFVFGPGSRTALSVDDFLGTPQTSTRASDGTITTAPQGTRGAASS